MATSSTNARGGAVLAADPRRVFLFSGHMIDAPGRPTPRFPPAAVPIARNAIEQTLDSLGAGAGDLAISSGACGGDLLFAEACLDRGVPLYLHLPFAELEFVKESVSFAGQTWRAAFFAVKADPRTTTVVMTDHLGASPADANAFERVNLWQMENAFSYGPEKVHFICLWNGEGGDGPGGTQHMMREVEQHAGQVFWLDTRKLWPL